jgi:hypothetical protein
MNKKAIAVVLGATLVGGAFFAVPAQAKKRHHHRKKPAVAVCTPYQSGDLGKDSPNVTVTDTATESAPLEQSVTLDPSAADVTLGAPVPGPGAVSAQYFNVQVDSAQPAAGLYAKITFSPREDYDLEFLYPDNSYAARSHSFNTVAEANDQALPVLGPISETGHGGQATDSSEELVGIATNDCAGYTVKVSNALGEGGAMKVQLWLGEIKNQPEAPGEEPGA